MKNEFKPTYKVSKACGNFYVRTLAERLKNDGFDDILVNAADPGEGS